MGNSNSKDNAGITRTVIGVFGKILGKMPSNRAKVASVAIDYENQIHTANERRRQQPLIQQPPKKRQ